MCCAQTAAPKGKKEKWWDMQKRGHCSNQSISQELPHKTLQNRGPEAPETHPNEAWRRPCEPRCSEEAPKSVQDALRRRPRSSQHWLRGPQERPKAKVGSILEAQDPPKSRPRREKSDVRKRCVLRFDFLVVQAMFWDGFFSGFCWKNVRKLQQCVFRETLENIDFT